MAVVIDELVSEPASSIQERGVTSQAGGGEETPEPSPHQIEHLMEMQLSRCERIRAY